MAGRIEIDVFPLPALLVSALALREEKGDTAEDMTGVGRSSGGGDALVRSAAVHQPPRASG